MSKLVKDYQNKNIDTIRDFNIFWYGGNRFNFKPYAGYVHQEFKSKNFNINKEGFRSKENFSEKLKSNKKIFFFGASGLVGIPNLSDDETLTSITEKKLQEINNNYEVLNFGLICARINSEFALITEMLNKYDPETIVIFTGYNDLHASYHGVEFGHYTDINNIMNYGFEHEKNKNNLIYGLETLIDTGLNYIKKLNLINKNNIFNQTEKMRKKRRFSLKKIEHKDTFNINKKMFLNHIEMLFYFLSKIKVRTIFIYQSSLLTTEKKLSPYEKEYFENYADLGMYKNSDKFKDQINMKNHFNEILNTVKEYSNKFNIDFINHEEEICNNSDKNMPIFFDNVHLTNYGTELLSKNILKKIT